MVISNLSRRPGWLRTHQLRYDADQATQPTVGKLRDQLTKQIDQNLISGAAQSLSSYLQSLNADVLLIVAENADPGEYGYAIINVKNPDTGVMTSHQVVVVDASATSDLDNAYVELIVFHELLHNLGVFDNSGFRTSYECSIETRPQQCDSNREPKDNIHDGMYETFPTSFCSWIQGYVGDLLESILGGLEGAEDGLTVCEYLALHGWVGNRQFVEQVGIPMSSGISTRAYYTGGGGGGGGGGGSGEGPPWPPTFSVELLDCLAGVGPVGFWEATWGTFPGTAYVNILVNYSVMTTRAPYQQPFHFFDSFEYTVISLEACNSEDECTPSLQSYGLQSCQIE